MTQKTINIGTAPNSNDGDTLRDAFSKAVDNFNDLYENKVDKTITINGHQLTGNTELDKSDIGLGNVDNTSDSSKPISTATQEALNNKQDILTESETDAITVISEYGITNDDIMTWDAASGNNNIYDFGISGNYYVSSSSGSDSNNGLTPSTAKATLAGIKALSPAAGSVISLKAGDTFREYLNFTTNGTSINYITFQAYGVGKKPIISACDIVTGFTQYSGYIYRASLTTTPDKVFVDGEYCYPARWPKEGWLTCDGYSSGVITCDELETSTDYVGATILSKLTQFTMKAETITANTDTTLTATTNNTASIPTGYGFFLQNKLIFLTQPNEWYYDATNQFLYIWLPESANPYYHTIEASVRDYGWNIWSNYVKIENIGFFGGRLANLYFPYPDYAILSKCDFIWGGYQSVRVDNGSTNLTVDSCLVQYSNGGGFCSWSPNAVYTNNTVKDIGLIKYWNSKSGTYCGFGMITSGLNGTSLTVHGNNVSNTGYSSINWNSQNAVISYNTLDKAMMAFGDGGALYTWQGTFSSYANTGSIVHHNNITNCMGNLEGTTSWSHYGTEGTLGNGYGIYMDLGSYGITVEHNTCDTCEVGITFGGTINTYIQNNLITNCSVGFVSWKNTDSMVTSYFKNNTIVAYNNLRSYHWWALEPEIMVNLNGGTEIILDNNTYVQNYSTSNIFRISTYNSGYKIDFDTYKTQSGQDANSVLYNGTYDGIEELYLNSTTKYITKKLDGNYVLPSSTAINKFSLEPFSGKLVINQN